MEGKKMSKICAVGSCEKASKARGWCLMHYARYRNNGDPEIVKKERHGQKPLYLYRLWGHIITRTGNKKYHEYGYYGGRGISMHQEWRDSFTQFRKDIISTIGERPTTAHSFDRIDTNGNYEPNNVRWATPTEQTLNQRRSKANTSGYVGVKWHKNIEKWAVSIGANNKRFHIGYFENKENAAYVYDQCVIQLHGVATRTNLDIL
jgi:hypothetical protein